MIRRQVIINSILIVSTFILSYYGREIINTLTGITTSSLILKVISFYSWWLVPTILLLGILYGFKNITYNIGLSKGLLTGLIFSIITVMPMIISSAIIGKFDNSNNIIILLQNTLIAGFLEEYFFRGFLFGILFRKLKWGFVPASILGAFLFGLGHIYQGNTIEEVMGVFAITALGAVWFAWLYIEWNNNLWVPIFLHILMNLSWILFDVSDNALGNIYTNIFRVITITLTIIITIYYHKKRGLVLKKNKLMMNNNC